MITVSIIMPVYNVEQYIEQAIQSVLKQSFYDFELLIIDDGSEDNSIERAKTFKDDRIKIIRQKNRGLAGARNTGIRNASGDLIAFLDSDDYWHPEKLMRLVSLMQSDQTCGVSFSSSLFVDDNGQSLNRIQKPARTNNFDPSYIFTRNPIGNGSAPIIRREILHEIEFTTDDRPYRQYFDETLRQSEDVECWTRIALFTQTRFVYVDEPLTFYRVNASGLSADVDKQFESWMYLLNKLRHYAPEFERKNGKLAKAFQLRYLARRLVSQNRLFNAARLAVMALITDVRILWQEPYKTIETLGASVGFCLIPPIIRNPVMNILINR